MYSPAPVGHALPDLKQDGGAPFSPLYQPLELEMGLRRSAAYTSISAIAELPDLASACLHTLIATRVSGDRISSVATGNCGTNFSIGANRLPLHPPMYLQFLRRTGDCADTERVLSSDFFKQLHLCAPIQTSSFAPGLRPIRSTRSLGGCAKTNYRSRPLQNKVMELMPQIRCAGHELTLPNPKLMPKYLCVPLSRHAAGIHHPPSSISVK
jgi:hypothetical protein